MQELREPVDLIGILEIDEAYYWSGQFYCSEATVKIINDAFRLPYPDEIIRLASGLRKGIGGAGCALRCCER